MDESKYAKGVISLQVTVEHQGTLCHIINHDPTLRGHFQKGHTWPGGYFYASGDLADAATHILKMKTGAVLEAPPVLRKINYSRTPSGHWISNRAFSARAKSLDQWVEPTVKEKGYSTLLVETDTLLGAPRTIVLANGDLDINTPFAWGINDGYCISTLAFEEAKRTARGLPMQEIPIVKIPVPNAYDKPIGWGLDVASLIISLTYKGKKGLVFIKNKDSDRLALVGGKVETLTGKDASNLDAVSCIISEGKEETGVDYIPCSVVACSLTPIQEVIPSYELKEAGFNSIMNTCVHARPRNAEQLIDAIENPERYCETEKVRGIYFVPYDELGSLLSEGLRTPDMEELVRHFRRTSHHSRPNLEVIKTLHTRDIVVAGRGRVETSTP